MRWWLVFVLGACEVPRATSAHPCTVHERSWRYHLVDEGPPCLSLLEERSCRVFLRADDCLTVGLEPGEDDRCLLPHRGEADGPDWWIDRSPEAEWACGGRGGLLVAAGDPFWPFIVCHDVVTPRTGPPMLGLACALDRDECAVDAPVGVELICDPILMRCAVRCDEDAACARAGLPGYECLDGLCADVLCDW